MTKKDPQYSPLKNTKGRGAVSNATGRFDHQQIHVDYSDYGWMDPEDQSSLKTIFYKDTTKSIVNENNSPDIPFRYSINAYRGCEHGCAYCYARPTHEYLGMSAGIDFESKIFVKTNAPELLRKKLMSPRWEPDCITMSGITDCYQPAERHFKITRGCLQVLAEFCNPVGIITKNHLVTRDIDILKDLAAAQAVKVIISVTSLDTELARVLEPRTSSPRARLQAIEALANAGIPVGVNVAPIIPALTDHEMPQILKAAYNAGARSAGHTVVRLPYSVKDIFSEWLEKNRAERKDKVLNAIRSVRGSQLNDPNFGSRMVGAGPIAENIHNAFEIFTRKFGFNKNRTPLTTKNFRRPGDQLTFKVPGSNSGSDAKDL